MHCFYDIVERFYIEMIPEAEYFLSGVTKDIMVRAELKWFSGTMTPEEMEQVLSYYKRRFGESE